MKRRSVQVAKARFSELLLASLLATFAAVTVRAETVLITGANSGIGLEFAWQYADSRTLITPDMNTSGRTGCTSGST